MYLYLSNNFLEIVLKYEINIRGFGHHTIDYLVCDWNLVKFAK